MEHKIPEACYLEEEKLGGVLDGRADFTTWIGVEAMAGKSRSELGKLNLDTIEKEILAGQQAGFVPTRRDYNCVNCARIFSKTKVPGTFFNHTCPSCGQRGLYRAN